MPSYISSHIIDAIDVMGNGHCGYRVISAAVYKNDDWSQVRHDLSQELHQNEMLYNQVFGLARKDELLKSLDCEMVPAPVEKWMTMPDMGLVVASCYNVQLVNFSLEQLFTFLPLHSAPQDTRKLICIGFINGNHYIHLKVGEECPMPRVFPVWLTYRTEVAEQWDIPFITRLQD
ncbi:hypothetical protein KSP39_PZI004074 [Platanthera zijinensis]|uniref:OTU domain-containing protein n=1 Tax=Platanthera zijinensis TaxID=2320716 RepID=A0AAP0BY57_9ASPA